MKGVSNLDVRVMNRKNVIQLLYTTGGLTKQEITEQLGLSLPTVTGILKDLKEHSLLISEGTIESTGGRRPSINKFSYELKYAIGIGITHRHIRGVLIDLGVNIVSSIKITADFEHTKAYWEKIYHVIEELLEQAKTADDKVLGVTISLPAIIDTGKENEFLAFHSDGSVIDLEKAVHWLGSKYRISFSNDANSAGITHIWNKSTIHDTVYLLLNQELGGSIINEETLSGNNKRSGEFGHMIVEHNGKLCACGRKGCFGTYCSSKVLMEESGDELPEFFRKLEEKDKKNIEIWDTYLEYLAIGISNIRMIFDWPIVIGGELSSYLKIYEDKLQEKLKAMNFIDGNKDFLFISNYGEYDVAIGGALLQIDEYFNII